MPGKSIKEFDAVVFGATGYTGRYVVEELAKAFDGSKRRWAVAGRNKEKVKASLAIVQQYLDIDIMNTPIIEADVSDEASISAMCKKTKLVLNCVGPFKIYGEVVVAACVENGTHHVDISGEIKYMELTQANYFDKARDNKSYIVQACGFDSIPADFGTAVMKKQFAGGLNSVESYVQFQEGPEGRVTNTGTWMSAVHSVSDVLQSGTYMRALGTVFDKKMPSSKYPLKRRLPFFYSDVVKGWCFWFIGSDERVIKRSQMFNYQFLDERPVQARAYLRLNSLFLSMCFLLFLGWFSVLSLFSAGRYLLGKYPSFFSGGMFSKEGPTRKQVEAGGTKVTLCGEGWSEKAAEPSDQYATPPLKKVKLVIEGPEPAYALTSICMVHSGITILEESDKMPLDGGVLTPGAAFANTSLRERLEKRGISFKFQE